MSCVKFTQLIFIHSKHIFFEQKINCPDLFAIVLYGIFEFFILSISSTIQPKSTIFRYNIQ